MYELRPRAGIHRTRMPKQATEQHQPPVFARFAKENSESSPSNKEDRSDDDEASENEEINEEMRKCQKMKKTHYARLYPDLSKTNLTDVNKKLKRSKEEKCTKLGRSEKSYSIFSGMTKYVVLIIAAVMILMLVYFSIAYSAKNLNCETPTCLFQDHFKNLRTTFVNQEKLSWKVIGSAVISVVNKTVHSQPAVILLIADKNAKEVSSCIANSLASSVEMSYGNLADHPKIQNKQYINSDEMKEVIYRTFKESFEKENHHAIVLEHLDNFAADAAMTLHLFCDHENAPYKNIVIILTAVLEEEFSEENVTLRYMHRVAENHLNKVWKSELWEEKRAALIARITGSVAVIRSEKNMPSTCYT